MLFQFSIKMYIYIIIHYIIIEQLEEMNQQHQNELEGRVKEFEMLIENVQQYHNKLFSCLNN